MLPLRFPRVWMSLGWILVIGVCVGSLLPAPIVEPIIDNDKLAHAGTYWLLMVWFSGMFARRHHWVIAVLLFGLGFGLDAAQAETETRSFDMLDVAADAGGILLGWISAWLVLEGWCRRVEGWFLVER